MSTTRCSLPLQRKMSKNYKSKQFSWKRRETALWLRNEKDSRCRQSVSDKSRRTKQNRKKPKSSWSVSKIAATSCRWRTNTSLRKSHTKVKTWSSLKERLRRQTVNYRASSRNVRKSNINCQPQETHWPQGPLPFSPCETN